MLNVIQVDNVSEAAQSCVYLLSVNLLHQYMDTSLSLSQEETLVL